MPCCGICLTSLLAKFNCTHANAELHCTLVYSLLIATNCPGLQWRW